MANDNEIIGSIGVQIEADASDLQGQYDAAVAQSEDAAERISQAFESLIGIGEALAITEGLKEFGEEALNVYGTVQSVTIGLTELTKSASQANEIIGQIKELANTEPFAFPEIAPTVQKMVALGVSAEAIPRVMQAAADTAAATGNSFDAVANAIDRMSLSGNAGARQLTQLGISTKDLGDIMGVSADQVKKAFTEMDQSERLDVLTQALDKFAGAAEAQAQGIAGQWQIFKNKFEEVMEGVGEALTPAITDILKFGDDAIQVAQELIDGFNKLPAPVKEVAGALGIAAAAIAPLAAGIGLLGQGLIGIQAVTGSVGTLLKALGLSAGEAATATTAEGAASAAAAPEVAALATAEAAAGESASISAVQLGLFGEAVASETTYTSAAITQLGLFDESTAAVAVTAGESAAAVGGLGLSFGAMEAAVATAGIAIAGVIGYKLGEWATNASPGFKDLTQSILETAYAMSPTFAAAFHALTGGFISFGGELEGQAEEIKNLQAQLATLGITVSSAGLTMEQYVDALRKARAAHQDLDSSVSGVDKTIAALTTTAQANIQAFQKAQEVFNALAAAQDGSQVKAIALAEAQKALDAAQKTLNAGSKDYQDTLSGVTEAYNKQQGIIDTLEQTKSQLLSIENRTEAQENILIEVSNKLAAAKKAEAEAHTLVKTAIQGQGAAYEGLVTSADAFLKKENDVSQAVVYAKSVLDDLSARNDTSAAGQRALSDAVNQYADALKKSGASMDDAITINVHGVDVMTTLGNAINTVKQSQSDWTSTMVNGVSVLKDHASAVSGVDQATQHYQGTIITGQPIIKGYIDDTTKAIGYNQQFTGSVNDLGAAIGNTLTPNLNSASSGLSNLSLEAEQADRSMKQLAADAKDAGDEISQAIGAMDTGKMGSADATGLGAWALAAQMTGETTFAGSGAAVNSQGQQVSALTELQAANQAAAIALAQSLGLDTTATTTQTTATVAQTKASTDATTATTALNLSINNLSTSANNSSSVVSSTTDSVTGLTTVLGSAAPVVDFAAMSGTQLSNSITSLNSQLLNAGVVVDGAGLSAVDYANKLQSTVDNMNASAAAVDSLSKSSSSAAVNIATAATVIAEAGQAVLQSATGSGPSSPSAALTAGAANLTANATPTSSLGTNALPVVLGTYYGPNGLNTITGTPGESLSQALAAMFPGAGAGSFSMQSAIAQTPAQPFGQASSSTTNNGSPVQVVMNYPQFNSQQQAAKTFNDMVTMLRTVPALKL